MKNKTNSLLIKNITRVLSANFLVAMVGFLGSFIFPKILTIESYALYHTFTLYVSYIGILHLGFPSGLSVKYAGKNYEDIDNKQYKTEISLIILILSFFSITFFGIYCFVRNKMLCYISLAIIPVCIISSYKALFQAWNRFKTYTKVSTIVSVAVPLVALLYYLINKVLPGDIYIIIYLIVYWIVAIILIMLDFKKIKNTKRNKFITKENLQTEKTGIALMLGNYINTLFVSVDKQFVKIFFSVTEFAYYSFGMSMQALMTVFITSVAQPLFPAMAAGKFNDEEYDDIKKMLLIFGSFSGCAYFATDIIVNMFIDKYIGSLEIVGIYFVVFPAMAVINCLYINLYKIKGLMKTYIKTLIGIFIIAISLNALFISLIGDFAGVAIATTITYYIWFLIGIKQFKFLKLSKKDVIYIIIYTIGFFIITRNMNAYIGIILYLLFILLLIFACYKKEVFNYIYKLRKNN